MSGMMEPVKPRNYRAEKAMHVIRALVMSTRDSHWNRIEGGVHAAVAKKMGGRTMELHLKVNGPSMATPLRRAGH